MATTSYFEQQLPAVGSNGKADIRAPATTVELFVSSYSGGHELYLKFIDSRGNEKSLLLDKKAAVDMLDGLGRAAFYLRYVE